MIIFHNPTKFLWVHVFQKLYHDTNSKDLTFNSTNVDLTSQVRTFASSKNQNSTTLSYITGASVFIYKFYISRPGISEMKMNTISQSWMDQSHISSVQTSIPTDMKSSPWMDWTVQQLLISFVIIISFDAEGKDKPI